MVEAELPSSSPPGPAATKPGKTAIKIARVVMTTVECFIRGIPSEVADSPKHQIQKNYTPVESSHLAEEDGALEFFVLCSYLEQFAL